MPTRIWKYAAAFLAVFLIVSLIVGLIFGFNTERPQGFPIP